MKRVWRRSVPLLKAGELCVVLLHFVIFSGVSLSGYLMLQSSYALFDTLFGALLFAAGALFSALMIQILIRRAKARPILHDSARLRRFIIVSAACLILAAVQPYVFSRILYAGLLFGEYVVFLARTGWLRFTSVDLLKFGIVHAAWLGQWYMLYVGLWWLEHLAIQRGGMKSSEKRER